MVSTTKLAADAGTAKLRSAVCISVINAKKESAMKQMAKIKYFLVASVAADRPRPRGSDTRISPCRFISRLWSRSPITVANTTTPSRIHDFTEDLPHGAQGL